MCDMELHPRDLRSVEAKRAVRLGNWRRALVAAGEQHPDDVGDMFPKADLPSRRKAQRPLIG
jgi:hypothetical protein